MGNGRLFIGPWQRRATGFSRGYLASNFGFPVLFRALVKKITNRTCLNFAT